MAIGGTKAISEDPSLAYPRDAFICNSIPFELTRRAKTAPRMFTQSGQRRDPHLSIAQQGFEAHLSSLAYHATLANY